MRTQPPGSRVDISTSLSHMAITASAAGTNSQKAFEVISGLSGAVQETLCLWDYPSHAFYSQSPLPLASGVRRRDSRTVSFHLTLKRVAQKAEMLLFLGV